MANLGIWHDDVNYIIAESAEEAREILKRDTGCTEEEAGETEDWRRWADAKPFTFVDDDAEPRIQVKPAAEWVALKGKGYFACSEY